MASFNKVILMGNLTREPEVRYTPSGTAVCDFSIAINRTYTSNNDRKEEVCYVDITIWGKQAENSGKYLQKGSPVLIEGRLHQDRWTDRETQQQRTKLKVVAERVQFLGAPGKREEFSDTTQNQQMQGYSGVDTQQPAAGFAGAQQPSSPAGAFPAPPAQSSVPPAQVQQPGAFPAAPMADQGYGTPAPADSFNTNVESTDDIPF